jgi:hypothetical protein
MLLVGKKEGRRPVGTPRHRCMDNIKLDLVDIGRGVLGLDLSG